MIVFKIGHKNYVNQLRASGVDGRWTSDGRMVVYAAESIALAFLENMVRRQGVGFNNDFKIALIEVPDDLQVQSITTGELLLGWRSPTSYSLCQHIGNKWYDEMLHPLLLVPSAVLPFSNNYVLNTRHPDFFKIRIVAITDLVPDERIEDILKGYAK